MAIKASSKENMLPEEKEKSAASVSRREIPGSLPYLPASGTLKKVLERLIDAQRPDRFNLDFLENILKITGGAGRGSIPILKRMGFLSGDGTPSELYAKFRTDSGRSAAALQGLKNSFVEIFKRSEYAHSIDDNKLKDIILEITGLKPNDPIAGYIKGTFNVIKSFISSGFVATDQEDNINSVPPSQKRNGDPDDGVEPSSIRLAYNINIILPETSDLNVLNAIFRSIKENLMR